MITDSQPEQEHTGPQAIGSSSHTGMFVAVFLLVAALLVGQVIAYNRINSLKSTVAANQEKLQKDMESRFQDELASRLTAIDRANAQQLEAIRQEMDGATRRMGSTGRELKHAREMVSKLQADQEAEANALKAQLAQKADQEQVGTLSQNVSAQKSDLDQTKKDVSTLTQDLGMARSEMGTLIARNHDDIEYLRKLGQRDYFEFTAKKNTPEKVGDLSVDLRKTNLKHHQFNMDLIVDDMRLEKKGRNVNEPIFFYESGQRKAYEIVINSVGSNSVTGYLSAPKAVTEVATTATH
jgi:chromosome segregation ATPase